MKVLVDVGMQRGTSAGTAALTPVICRPKLLQFLWQKLESFQRWGGGCRS